MMDARRQIPDVQCPFYITVLNREIVCEGSGDAASLRLRYHKNSQKEKHMEVFCCDSYKKCEIYRMLMETKYDL